MLIGMMATGQVDKKANYNQSWSNRDKLKYKFITVGFDARNAVVGSDPTGDKPELDYQIKIEAGSVIRWDDDNFLMGGGNAELRQHVGYWIVGGQVNYRYRGEWEKMVGSFMVNLTRKF